MAVNLIQYDEQRHKVAKPITTREEYLSLRDSEENKRAEKHQMVQFNYSLAAPQKRGDSSTAVPGTVIDENVEILSFPLRGSKTLGNSVGMDVDHIDDVQATIDMVMAKKDELGLLMLEKSASGKGLHLVFKRHAEMSNEENLRWASDLLGVEFDKGAKDVTRVFFTPTSDNMLFLDDEIFEAYPCPPEGKEIINTPKTQKRGDSSTAVPGTVIDENVEIPSYLGIPYDVIIEKYWEMFYNSQHPVKSNRDTLTYELANVMKHICGFDRNVLAQVIPCYDGFPETEKMKCIDSALSGKRTQMPRRLRDVLTSLRRSQLINANVDSDVDNLAFDEALAEDELFYYNRIPKGVMVQGIKESIDAAGHTLSMPTLVSICPAIGARATGVQLVVHGKANTLNLIAYVAGDFASGKGQMDDVVKAWMSEDIAMAEMYNQQWEEWRDKYKQQRNKKELPIEPRLPKVWLTLNNTTANLAESLANVQGRHAFSFTPEADVVSLKWKSSVSDFSTMIRQSYDASSYDREARSVDAVNVHISKLLWNVVMCGTPDALYRVVNNYTDGFQSRIAVARTPDNTYAPLDDNPAHLTDIQKEKIEQVSHLLPLMNGVISLPKLEAKGREWLEGIRLETLRNDDKVMARQRFRVCVTAQRMTCCLMLVAVCAKLIKEHGVSGAEKRLKQDPTLWQKMMEKMQTQAFLELFDIIADSLIDNNMYFFRTLIEQAMSSSKYCGGDSSTSGNRRRKGKNDSIYARLAQEFSFGEATSQSYAIKGSGVTENAVRQMLKNWERQGLISVTAEGSYRKVQMVQKG